MDCCEEHEFDHRVVSVKSVISPHFSDSVSGPEKADVGGSIPSLATIPN